ncbi:MAG: molybdopterin cofactor-binding domain-containing protein, partial [Pseudomonadota bacterium]
NTFCVFTNRTPATAMRGFGITGVDFAIECHMDRVAEAVGIDPISLRILNSYRDGDVKAHRRVAKNCALVESCQVAAGKANWILPATDTAQSSMVGSSAERAAIPETALDEEGKIGERRAGRTASTSPAPGTRTLPAGTQGRALEAIPPQRPDMAQLPDRVGHETPTKAPPVPAMPTRIPAAAGLPATPTPTAQPGTPSLPAAAAAVPPSAPTPPPTPQPHPTPPQAASTPTAPTASTTNRRLGASRFLSGPRRR